MTTAYRHHPMIGRLIAIALMTMIAAGQPATCAAGKDLLDGLCESVAKMTGLMIVNQIIIYGIVASYHMKFNKWPAGKDELAAALSEGSINPEKEQGRDPLETLGLVDMKFTDTGGGKVLVEARYSDEMEDKLQHAGLGRMRISAVASCDNGEYVFTPSEKTRGDRDYLTMPATIKPRTRDAASSPQSSPRP